MISTESTVEFKMVRVIKERASKGKQQFLEGERKVTLDMVESVSAALTWHRATLVHPEALPVFQIPDR